MDRYLQYTESQLKVMAIVPKVTSFISLACMSYVGQLIIRFRRRRLYHNLFLGMAAHDIIKDLTFIVGTWAIPRGSPGYFMAWGDQTSCSVQAFLSQASFGVFTYVCAVCIFSCYAVRYDCKEESYRRRYEGIAHLVCTIIPIGFALALVISGFQGPDGSKFPFVSSVFLIALFFSNLINSECINLMTLNPPSVPMHDAFFWDGM